MRTAYGKRLAAGSLFAVLTLPCAAAPRIEVDADRHDFGERGSHETVEHVFTLSNEGTAELLILRTGSGCACTVADLARRSLAPGESVALPVRVPLAGRSGLHRVTVNVESSDPARPRLRLIVQGRVSREIELRPTHLHFGTLVPGEPAVRGLRLAFRDAGPEVTRVESLSPWFEAKARELAGERAWHIEVTARGEPPPGTIEGALRLHTTHPRFPRIDVGLSARAAGALTWMPRALMLPGGEDPAPRFVIVRSGTADAFSITRIEAPPPIEAQILPLPGAQAYRVQFPAVPPLAELAGQLVRIHTDCPGQPVIELPIRLPDNRGAVP